MAKAMRNVIFSLVLIAGVFLDATARAAPPVEAYGALPTIRSMALSPDGQRVAFIRRQGAMEALHVYDFKEGVLGGVRTDNIKAGWVFFAGPNHVILSASKTTQMVGYRGRFEFSAAFSYDIEKDNIRQLLAKPEDLYPAQSGLGDIVGVSPDGGHVFMPGFTGRSSPAPFSLFKVNLSTGRGRIVSRGGTDVIDWLVNEEGEPFAREEYNNNRNAYEIKLKDGGGWKVILEDEGETPPYSLIGGKSDGSALVVNTRFADEEYSGVYQLDFDGTLSAPLFKRDNADIAGILTDNQRRVFGARYSGFYPHYEFFDEALTQAVSQVQAQKYFGDDAVQLISWSDDFNRLLLYVEGGEFSGDYFLYDRRQNSVAPVVSARPEIKAKDIGKVFVIEYKARDDLTIPALLTLPSNGLDRDLPLIVMPHGGPESYDAVGFHWMAQFFASRGYMVLQPNFRGSTGFGAKFRDAGRGEWGRKMQDDITDGVLALIRSGRADPNRICIVGGSYGGYAALAGGAFTPDLYQCVAAIAPVADLPMMLSDERRDSGARHWVYDYWKQVIGDPRSQRERLEEISPVNAAEAFQAPVLLIHGRDDLVVPIRQSARMEAALKRAGKEVEFIRLKGEDHHLSNSETRLETLKALDAFVTEHIGAAAPPADD